MKTSNWSKKAGFTLVELMVVAIIVAILAAVAIPLMSANKKRAAATEGESGLGTARSALRAMYAETGAYNKKPDDSALNTGAIAGNVPGIADGDLNGKYFVDGNYTLTAVSTSNYTLQVSGTTGLVAGVTITLKEDGSWTKVGL
jgi:type IV pilus assembly protein PilA